MIYDECVRYVGLQPLARRISFSLHILTLYSPVVTMCTASLACNNSTFCPHSVFMGFVWIWEQTAIISLYSINCLIFITEKECVYCAVRTGSLYNSTFCPHSVFTCFVWISAQTATCATYSNNWLVFITETECVYGAVRTGSSYIIQVFPGLMSLDNTVTRSWLCLQLRNVYVIWNESGYSRYTCAANIDILSTADQYEQEPVWQQRVKIWEDSYWSKRPDKC